MKTTKCGLNETQWAMWSIQDMLNGVCMTASAPLPIPLGVDHESVHRALAEVVARHEALRTVYRCDASGLQQVIFPRWDYQAETVSTGTLGRYRDAIEHERAVLASEVVDVASTPAWRLRVITGPADRACALLVINRLNCDLWGFKLLSDEFVELCVHAAGNRPFPRPWNTSGWQPRHQAEWEASPIGQVRLEEGLAYWKRRLERSHPYLAFPPHPLPPAMSAGGIRCSFSLSAHTVKAVAEFVGRFRATPFQFFLAVLRVLFFHAVNQDDVVVATNHWNRTGRSAFVVGEFSKLLFLRERVSGRQTFSELMCAVRRGALEAHEHLAYSSNELYNWGIRQAWERGVPIPRWDKTKFVFNAPAPDALRRAPTSILTTSREIPRRCARAGMEGAELQMSLRPGEGATGEFVLSDVVATERSLGLFVDEFLALITRICSDESDGITVAELECSLLEAEIPRSVGRRLIARGLPLDLASLERAVRSVQGVRDCEARLVDSELSPQEVEVEACVEVGSDALLSVDDVSASIFQALGPYSVMPHRLTVRRSDCRAERGPAQAAETSGVRAVRADTNNHECSETETKLLRALGDPPLGVHTPAWDLNLTVGEVPKIQAKLLAAGLPHVPGLAWLFALPISLYRIAAWIDEASAGVETAK